VNKRIIDTIAKGSICPKVKDKLSAKTPVNYKARALERVCIEAYGAGTGHEEFTKDGEQAVQQAVMWCMTKDERYACNALSILHAWANSCVSFEGSNAPLELGWGTCSLVRAAEILRYTYPKWNSKDNAAAVNKFIDNIAMPKLTKKLGWTNNWQITICEARLQIAIFRDDRAEFDWAVSEYRRIFKEYVRSDGTTAETGRDLVHAQFGIGGLMQIPELVFEYTGGGVDLFQPLLARVCEVHADMILNKRGKDPWFLPCGWEIALRKFGAVRVPNTKRLLDKHGPELYVFHWGLGRVF
jgi:hypothetical protein